MAKMKYYTVVLDGIDKSGKDLIANYIWRLDKRLNVIVRGWPSLYVYNKVFNRHTEYALPTKMALYVHLDVDVTDWLIRCATTNEPDIDFNLHSGLFVKAFNRLIDNGYKTITFNTSMMTPYQIASNIVAKMKSLNGEK